MPANSGIFSDKEGGRKALPGPFAATVLQPERVLLSRTTQRRFHCAGGVSAFASMFGSVISFPSSHQEQ
jgi:hypothetical protein